MLGGSQFAWPTDGQALWDRWDLLLQSSEITVVYVWFWKWHKQAVWSAETTNISCCSYPARDAGVDRTLYYLGLEELTCFNLMRIHTSLSFPFRQCSLQPQFQHWPLVLVVVTKTEQKTPPSSIMLKIALKM